MLLRISIATIISLLMFGCGGGGGGGVVSNCDKALTVDYIQNEFDTDFIGFTVSGTTIVHTDGNQGNTYDIDTVAVSRTNYTSYTPGDSLAFSYTIHGTTAPPAGTYIAFFIDIDKTAATGMMDGTIGADALVVNAAGGSANGYYLWIGSSWVKQDLLGTLSSNASYFQGCSYSTTIYAPLYSGLNSLYSTPVTGVVKLLTIPGSDPTTITSILDTSSEFNFTMP